MQITETFKFTKGEQKDPTRRLTWEKREERKKGNQGGEE